jgi:hypothetical protein
MSMFYARTMTVPDEAQIWIGKNKFKGDRLILGERKLIVDLEVWF